MEKQKILKYIERLNQTEEIKINNSDKTRLIFKNSDEVFKIFGEEEKGVLNPYNDYSYRWLSSFISNVVNFIENESFDNFNELSEKIQDVLFEWVDSEVDIYTSGLTEWLNDSNANIYYIDEVIKEGGMTEGFNLFQVAQFKAIEEAFYNALNVLIENLKENFE